MKLPINRARTRRPIDILAVMRALSLSLLSVVVVGCTERNPNFCSSDADCAGTPQPFCDVNGEFAESNGNRNICIPRPEDCPIERCGCTPGEGLACDLDQLTVCAADGRSTETETCALGCSTEDRCLTFEPSNGLGEALTFAKDEPALTVPSGAVIDTELGTIRTNQGTIEIKSMLVAQSDGSSIRAFVASELIIEDALVRGTHALALVSVGPVAIRGRLDVSATGTTAAGAGSLSSPTPCAGAPPFSKLVGNPMLFRTYGGSGSGNATAGGAGGGYADDIASSTNGGAPLHLFSPLMGGCSAAEGGAGGGAVQVVSLDEILISEAGFVDVGGGGGGSNSSGGGSGGTVVLEAPEIRIVGPGAGIVANGGSGGACGMAGSDGTDTRAIAPRCADESGGDGGTDVFPPGSGQIGATGVKKGGGGGSVGRARFATRAGTAQIIGNPKLSVAIVEEVLRAE